MTADPAKVADTHAWLVKAQRDLTTAEQLLAYDQPLLDSVVYHCHQSAEKALKGYLFWHDIPFRRTHALNELLTQCISVDGTLSALEESARRLTPMATAFRYPGLMLEPPLDEATQALAMARAVLDAITARLPEDVRPRD